MPLITGEAESGRVGRGCRGKNWNSSIWARCEGRPRSGLLPSISEMTRSSEARRVAKNLILNYERTRGFGGPTDV